MAESFNDFPKVVAAMEKAQAQVIKKTAFDLQAAMQAKIRANGQIDTGFMVNSVYVRTYSSSTYASALLRKTRLSQKPTKSGKPRTHTKRQIGLLKGMSESMLPEVERPENKHTAYVCVAASYGFWQNYGTHRLPARPFLEPSVELVRPEFEAALGKIEAAMKAMLP